MILEFRSRSPQAVFTCPDARRPTVARASFWSRLNAATASSTDAETLQMPQSSRGRHQCWRRIHIAGPDTDLRLPSTAGLRHVGPAVLLAPFDAMSRNVRIRTLERRHGIDFPKPCRGQPVKRTLRHPDFGLRAACANDSKQGKLRCGPSHAEPRAFTVMPQIPRGFRMLSVPMHKDQR